jgi:rhomboid protease GluP
MTSTKGDAAMDDYNLSPFNRLPPVVVALAVVIAGLEAMFQAASIGLVGGAAGVAWRIDAIRDWAVFDEILAYMQARGAIVPGEMVRLLSYPLIHGGAVHAGFVVVFILAIGKMVAEVFSPLAFVVLFWAAAVVGALGYVVLLDSPYPLIGGYPGVYGLIGAFTYILWTDAKARGGNRYRAFGLIGMLLAIQLLFGLLEGQFANVVADLSGFAAGFALSFVMRPGGMARILAKLRQR